MQLSRAHQHEVGTDAFRQTTESLQRGCDASACTTVVRRLAARFDAEFEAAEPAGVACAAGCAFCCHLRVDVFPHEAVALWRYLQTSVSAQLRARIEARVRDNARRIDGFGVAEHRAARLACAFLVEGRCSAHDVRPSACAAYHSLSRERCEQIHREPQHIGTPRNSRPALLELKVRADALIEATAAGLTAASRSSAQIELHQALRKLLDDPDAVARWCSDDIWPASSEPRAG